MMGDNKTENGLKWVLSFNGATYVGDERTPNHACISIGFPIGDHWTIIKIKKGDTFENRDRVRGVRLGNWYVDYVLSIYPFFANSHEDAIRQGCDIMRNVCTQILSNLSNAESFPLVWENAGLPVNLKTLDENTNGALRN